MNGNCLEVRRRGAVRVHRGGSRRLHRNSGLRAGGLQEVPNYSSFLFRVVSYGAGGGDGPGGRYLLEDRGGDMAKEGRGLPAQQQGLACRIKRWILIRGFAAMGYEDPAYALDYPELLEEWMEKRRLFLERD